MHYNRFSHHHHQNLVQVVPHVPQPQQTQHETPPTTLPNIQQNHATTQNITIEVSSPTYIQLQRTSNTFGMTGEQLRRPAVRTPVRRAHRSRTPSRAAPAHEQALQTTPAQPRGAGTETPPLPAPALAPEHIPITVSDGSSGDLEHQVPQTPEDLNPQASTPKAAGSSATWNTLA